MFRKPVSIPALSVLFVLVLFVSACGGSPTPAVTPTSADPTGTVLELVGPNGGHALKMADLRAMPATEGQAGIKSSTGAITIPERFKGVSLKDLVASLNVTFDDSMGITVFAEDGYSMTFSYDQVMNGSFIAYDPAMGNELAIHDPLTAMIAYEHNGAPLRTNEEGVLRLVVVSDNNTVVVDGHWSVKWVTRVEVHPVGQEWSLDLSGAIASPVTRDSYQSCGSPSCHGTSWQDEDGQDWVGVPIWVLVGEVDDADSHSEEAFNRSMAEAGYTIDIVAADGYTVSLDSALIKDNNQVLLAFLVNDGELPEKYYPLRLVGAGLEKNQMVGQVVSIHVNVAPISAAVADVPENEGSLLITGLVNQEITFLDADLRSQGIITVNAEGKNGPQDFQGVLLNPLLDQAGLQAQAKTLVFTSSDGYTAEVSLADVRNSPQALIAFMDTPGVYMLLLPDQPTSTWVKYIVSIEVK